MFRHGIGIAVVGHAAGDDEQDALDLEERGDQPRELHGALRAILDALDRADGVVDFPHGRGA